jgi:acetate kinase
MSAAAVDDLLNHRSGLLGLSGRSADMREIQQAADAGDHRAELALEVFAYRARKYLGGYTAALGGVDAIAFAGGIGEHSPQMRARICRGLEFLGIVIDSAGNDRASGKVSERISSDAASVQLWVVPTDEEGQIARELFNLLSDGAPSS